MKINRHQPSPRLERKRAQRPTMGLVSLPLGSSSQKAYEGMTAAQAIDAETASRLLFSRGMRRQEGNQNETAAGWYPFGGWRRGNSRALV